MIDWIKHPLHTQRILTQFYFFIFEIDNKKIYCLISIFIAICNSELIGLAEFDLSLSQFLQRNT